MKSDIIKINTIFEGMQLKVKKIKIKQLGVNSSTAIVSQKLQGMTNYTIVSVRNDKRVKNWLHAALSRLKK